MTCTQVMYQPYASYLPYERSATTSSTEAAPKKYQHAHESSSPEDNYPLLNRSPYPLATTDTGVASPVAGPSSVIIPRKLLSPPDLKDSGQADQDAESGESCHAEAQYLSANCVIYMNYRGDAASVVDEHFHRALSQDSFNPNDPKSNLKGVPSMSERQFPPSFWNSDYQPPGAVQQQAVNYSQSQGSHDFFSHAHAVASLHNHHAHLAAAAHHHHHHHQGDHPWHYSLGQAAYSHNLSAAYPVAPAVSGMSGRSSFNSQYGSFLLPSGHPARLAGAPVKSEPWATRYPDPLNFSADLSHPPIDAASAYSGHSYSNMTGLDASQVQEPPTKDLYWF